MGEAYLLDTSAVSKYLRGVLPDQAADFIDNVLIVPAKISVVARIELEVYNPPTKTERDQFLAFVREATVIDLSELIIQQTVQLRRHYKGLKLPDAIIAATAIVNNLTLLSTNDSDFNRVSNLSYRSLNAYQPERT